jgi:hypothetical protein
MELTPFDHRLFTPTRMDRGEIIYLPNEQEAFSLKKTERTYWIRLLFEGSVYRLECKKNLNKASSLADKIRESVGKDPIWILCSIRVRVGDEQRELAVYIKRQQLFAPRHMQLYHLEPKCIIEGSGKDLIESKSARKTYSIFIAHRRHTDPRCISVIPTQSHPDFFKEFRILLWSEEEFVVDSQKRLGSGTSKVATLAVKVEIINPYHFIASKRALLTQKTPRSRVDFDLDRLKGLSHPNLGSEDKNIRYAQHWIATDRMVQIWYKLTYLGKDLFGFAQIISSEKALYRTMAEMIAGVKYLHDNGFLHRDLKLLNWICYTDDTGRFVIKLEDCDSAGPINTTPILEPGYQTVHYLPLNLRKVILDVAPEGTFLYGLTNERYYRLWTKSESVKKESVEAERNTLGFCLAEVYFIFRKNHLLPLENKRVLEAMIASLTRFSLRKNNCLYLTFYNYLCAIDHSLKSNSNTLEEIEAEMHKIPPLEETLEILLSLYRGSAN